jgi:oligopeptide/dipeptide ABC transporter ATP-binding protein
MCARPIRDRAIPVTVAASGAGCIEGEIDTVSDTRAAGAPIDAASPSADDVLLELRNLRTWYPTRSGGLGRGTEWVKAVDDVSFTITRGETFGLVGESGCGKTTLGRSILRLEQPHSGQIIFEGEDLLTMPSGRLKQVRRNIQAIFQDPHGSLDPRMKVRDLIAEGLVVQGEMRRDERDARVAELIDVVGLRREHLDRYPHEFSGGQRQRIGIARALALRPKFVLADEPVSALDLSVQSQVLNLLSDLQEEFGLTYLFIAHDLSVVEYLSDRVGVMYLGRIVELARAEALYDDPLMPYTKALLSAIPGSEQSVGRARIILQGDVPSPLNPPSGCPFRTRCWRAQDVCRDLVPPLREVKPEHFAACHFA